MVKTEEKDKFIELRAAGLSFDSIAKQLNISKPTLLKMAKDFQADIERLKFINLESLAERYKVLRAERLAGLGRLLGQVDTALEAADFDRLSPEKLIDLKMKLTDKMHSLITEPFSIEKNCLSELVASESDFELKID
jgi:hypothetical protein